MSEPHETTLFDYLDSLPEVPPVALLGGPDGLVGIPTDNEYVGRLLEAPPRVAKRRRAKAAKEDAPQ